MIVKMSGNKYSLRSTINVRFLLRMCCKMVERVEHYIDRSYKMNHFDLSRAWEVW